MKRQIQEVALELIVQKGLKFTMSDIAAKKEISKRTIYEHFNSKQQIIETIVDEAIAEVKQEEQKVFRREEWNNEQKLKAVLSIVPSGLQFGDQQLLEQMKQFAPSEWGKIQNLLQNEWETVQKILERGIESGEFYPMHVPSVIQLLRGASIAIFDPDFHDFVDQSVHNVVHTMVDVFLHGIVKGGKK